MSDESQAKERRILSALRKVLGNIVKDATPEPGMPHPFRESTVQEIRELFGLIAEREAELAEEAKLDRNERPYYVDEPPNVSVVTLHRPPKNGKPN
ncbi:MAG: hypothetical protein PHY45_00670 [Rhodocyclaceae bacterium]|nr:hypothetical protein [Rhodocyclaceae bacterium]